MALPPPASRAGTGGSAPIAIGSSTASWRSGGSISPMEADADQHSSSVPLSRSWDDCEVARSILNLNSPNGFHPLAGNAGLPPPPDFSLGGGMPSAPAAGASMLGAAASMMAPPPAHGSSMLGTTPPMPLAPN